MAQRCFHLAFSYLFASQNVMIHYEQIHLEIINKKYSIWRGDAAALPPSTHNALCPAACRSSVDFYTTAHLPQGSLHPIWDQKGAGGHVFGVKQNFNELNIRTPKPPETEDFQHNKPLSEWKLADFHTYLCLIHISRHVPAALAAL